MILRARRPRAGSLDLSATPGLYFPVLRPRGLAAAVSVAFACALTPARAAVKNPGVYTHLVAAMADSVGPYGGNQDLLMNVYEPLFAYDGPAGAAPTPLLASAVPTRSNGLVSKDGRTIRLPIRKGVKFHDGSELTPEDVRHALLRQLLLEPPEGGGLGAYLRPRILGLNGTRDPDGRLLAGLMASAERAVAVEKGQVVLRLPAPDATIIPLLGVGPVVAPRRWLASKGDWDGTADTLPRFNAMKAGELPELLDANGTGPFRLERWDRTSRQVVLARHDAYWRARARMERVVVKVVPEFLTRRLMLEAGDADSIVAYRAHAPQLAGLAGVVLIDDLLPMSLSPMAFFNLGLSTSANRFIGSGALDGEGIPPDFFADREARLGFVRAFDYEAFLREVLRGKGASPDCVVPAALTGRAGGDTPFRTDRTAAEAHFRRAWGGRVWEKGFKFSLVYNNGNDLRRDMAAVLKRNVESLNPLFRVEVLGLDWPAFLEAMSSGRLPIEVSGVNASYADPDAFVSSSLHSAGVFARRHGYSNPEADRLIEAARREIDPRRRAEHYRRLRAVELHDVPHIIPAEPTVFRVHRSWVRGWTFQPLFPNAPHSGSFYALDKGG